MPKAIRITEKNFEMIANVTKISIDEIKDNYEYYAEDGIDSYQIIDGSVEENNFTATTVSYPAFHQSWKFTDIETTTEFTKIEKL